MAVKVACYILIGVGAFSMLMGFLGCLGAIYEIRCLLGLVSDSLYLWTYAYVYVQPDHLNMMMNNAGEEGFTMEI